MGLQTSADELRLKSSAVMVVDQTTGEVLLEKNSHAVLPIASLTKLMTALVVRETQQPMDDVLEITAADSAYEKQTRSRLRNGTRLSRREMMILALMSSENRAASALGRAYPNGLKAFVGAMNQKALELGMGDTHYEDPTGLSHMNTSSAADLVRLVKAAYDDPVIREFSTQHEYAVKVGRRQMRFHSSNRLVTYSGDWEIGLQKTGFTNEAGRCLVMQAAVQGRPVVMVFLDSFGKLTRFADANRVRHWLEHPPVAQTAVARKVIAPLADRPM